MYPQQHGFLPLPKAPFPRQNLTFPQNDQPRLNIAYCSFRHTTSYHVENISLHLYLPHSPLKPSSGDDPFHFQAPCSPSPPHLGILISLPGTPFYQQHAIFKLY